MKNKKGGKKGGLIILIIAIVIVMAVVLVIKQYSTVNLKDNIEEIKNVNLEELRQEYITEINKILPEYQEVLESADQVRATELRKKLLELKMPAEFREAHVKLVLLLDKIEQGTTPNESLVALSRIIKNNAWLKH